MHVIFEEAAYFKEGGLIQKLCFVFICLFVVDLLGGGGCTVIEEVLHRALTHHSLNSSWHFQFEADRRAFTITTNSFGTELSKDDRNKLYPRCGKLFPEGLARLARADDYDQVRAVADYYSVSGSALVSPGFTCTWYRTDQLDHGYVIALYIGHYQNEWEAWFESMPQRRSFNHLEGQD